MIRHTFNTTACLVLTGIVSIWTTSASAATTPNLLVDPSFELPTATLQPLGNVFLQPVYGVWGVDNASNVTAEVGITPLHLNQMHRMDDDGLGTTQSLQNVDVSAYSAVINAGNAFADASAWYNTENLAALGLGITQASLFVTFRDSGNNTLGAPSAGFPFFVGVDSNPATWESLSLSNIPVPINTDRIEFQVAYANATLQSGNAGYVDMADLRLNLVPEPSSIALAGLGVAGFVAVVVRRRK
jgi:hypothetical protein